MNNFNAGLTTPGEKENIPKPMNNYMTRLFSVILLLLSLFPSFATEPLERLLRSGKIDPKQSALLVTDLSDGRVIDAHNTSAPFIPASIMKCVTIASLLPESGTSYRYQTRILADAPVNKGILEGNLIIEGAGDPSIDAGCEPAGPDFVQEVVKILKNKGIKRIEGKVIIDKSVFTSPAIHPTWAAADTKQKYGTGCHGFNYRHNATGNQAVADPSALFRRNLATALSSAGITLAGKTLEEGERKELGIYRSAQIDEIMRSCMMRSDNLFAEALLRTLPVVSGKPGDTTEAAAMEIDYWQKKGVPTEGVRIIDGSGLSRTNRVTADFMGGILTEMSDNPDYASFLPLAGQEGTLASFLKDTPLDSYIAMKTGSMNGIQCYAGYKLDEDFVPTHVIVLILNALPKGRPAARQAFANYLLETFPQ